jgi:hypothetical protein
MLSDAALLKNADWRLIEEALNIVESRQESHYEHRHESHSA